MTDITPELIAAYRATDYVAKLPDGPATLRVDTPCPALAAYLAQVGAETAGVITAYNPYSEPCEAEENRTAHAALKETLKAMGLATLPCDGSDPAGHWPTEHGLLVPGIGKAALRGLATVFGQNAVLWIEADGVPRLELLR